MNLNELEKKILDLGVEKDSFGINRKPTYEGNYIIKEDKVWKVYYYERGESKLLNIFKNESEAALFMLKEVRENYNFN